MLRVCEVCGSNKQKKIHRQRFVLPTKNFFHGGYDVAICENCGFSFASNIPSQDFFDSYYAEMAKKSFYISKKIFKKKDTETNYDKEMDVRLKHTLKNIVKFADKKDKILDIGCYTGELLHLLKKKGYKKLTGADPSPLAVDIAKEKYGLKVIESNVYDGKISGTYDFILLTHVLEHIKDLRKFIAILSTLLSPNGKIYIESPDAHNFFYSDSDQFLPEHQEAYQQFSLEHINFFTKESLNNLMIGSGFQKILLESDVSVIAILASVWEKQRYFQDDWIAKTMNQYLEESEQKLSSISDPIDAIVKSKKKIYVWGAGGHTQKILSLTNLIDANIVAFIDSNPSYQDSTLVGKPIFLPDQLADKANHPILISSKGFQKQIIAEIKKRKLPNTVLTLY